MLADPDAAERALIEEIFATIADAGHVARMLAVLHRLRQRPTSAHRSPRRADEAPTTSCTSAADDPTTSPAWLGSPAATVTGWCSAVAEPVGSPISGVLQALREQGVPVDQVAGCSMGSAIAAAIALDVHGEELLALVEQQFHKLLDYTMPVVSIVKGRRIMDNIEATLGGWDIEDLWVPYYCVSTNLTKSRLEVHRRGSTAVAVRASVAIPGVLPPVPYDGDLLVDGGVLNNMPFEVMRDDSTIGTIIAVDVAPDQGPRARADFGMSVSGFRALGASLKRSKSVLSERHVGAVAEHVDRRGA